MVLLDCGFVFLASVLCRAMLKAIFLGVITGSSTIMATMDTFVVKEAEFEA